MGSHVTRWLNGLAAFSGRLRQSGQRARSILYADWLGEHYLVFGLVILLISGLAVISFYLNHPQPAAFADTPSYLVVSHQILTTGNPVNPVRTPGYPLLIALVFLVCGKGNLLMVSSVQALLFVLATLEVYLLACLLFRHAWIGLVVGVLVGSNMLLIAYVQPLESEALALWLTVSLALLLVRFVQTTGARDLWLVAACTLILFLTRAEWIYLPVPLFAYLLLMAAWRRRLRPLLPHALAALGLLYLALGVFIYTNASQNSYAGVTVIERINLLGKVMQYHMQNEAAPQYAAVAHEVNAYMDAPLAHPPGRYNPYNLAWQYPEIAAHYWALGGAYAASVVEGHPLEFLAHTSLVMLTSLNEDTPAASLFFPMLVILWLGLLLWRRTRRRCSVKMVSAVLFVSLYDLLLTSLGAYGDYERFHVPFDPLLTLVIWGSLLTSLPLLKQAFQRRMLAIEGTAEEEDGEPRPPDDHCAS